MISRKITYRADISKIDELISLLSEENTQNEDLIANSILTSDSLTPYFYNLPHLITHQNLIIVRRYEVLNDGLYILLKGQVSFMSCVNVEKNIRNTKSCNASKNSIAAVLSTPLCVFESTSKNCTTLEESYVLKMTEEQIMASRFLEMFGKRAELYEKHYLACDHQTLYNTEEINDIVSTDLKIHSNFCFKKYSFRQIIVLNTAGIIDRGRVRLKMHNHQSHQMDRFGLLLPYLTYEVASSELSIMVVQNNETLSYKIDIQMPLHGEHSPKLPLHKANCNSLLQLEHLRETKHYENIHWKKEKECREKQIVKLTKQSENYSIISSFLCQKSLEFVRKQNLRAKTKEKKQNRYKNPLILFNIVNEKSKLAIPSFTDTANTPTSSRINTKYIQQFNITPDSGEANNKSIFRKIKLPPADYEKIVRKHQQKQSELLSRKQIKNKTLFTLNIGQHLNDSRGQEESFVRYCKAE